MEGPRPVKGRELGSVLRLVDDVFWKGNHGRMLYLYPHMFSKPNFENLFVYVDKGRVVSHVGMVQRWACLAGCTVRVALIGAVATREEYRGRRLAGDLFKAACDKAFSDGVDIMMISGGRTLYLSAGAERVGHDTVVDLQQEHLRGLSTKGIEIAPFKKGDLTSWADAYAGREAHFIRPPEDWLTAFEIKICMNDKVRFWTVRKDGIFRGYFIAAEPDKKGVGEIAEFAGGPMILTNALKPLAEEMKYKSVRIQLQSGDRVMKEVMKRTGASMKETATSGTLLLISFPQLMKRLTPFIETRIGIEKAKRLQFEQVGEKLIFKDGRRKITASRAEAARIIFGHPDAVRPASIWTEIFPAPTLWYGINYV